MLNKLKFEGHIEEIRLKNEKVLKFVVVNQERGRVRKITATVFNGMTTGSIYNSVEELVGRLVIVGGELYESNYLDRRTNQWVNAYCVQVNELVAR